MSKVITKLRAYSPNKKDTPTGNMNHLYYIATRTNAMCNEYGSTIFGYYNYNKLQDDITRKDVAKYIKKISQEKNNVYRGIISLREEDAIRLGYDKRETWEMMIKKNIQEIAKVVNVPFSRLEYVGVFHLKKGNPHLHYMFWDREQKINKCYISEYQQNKIRDIITKGIYKEEMEELYKERDEIKNDLKSRDFLAEMKIINIANCDSKIPFQKIKDRKILIKEFKRITKLLPKTRKTCLCLFRQRFENCFKWTN